MYISQMQIQVTSRNRLYSRTIEEQNSNIENVHYLFCYRYLSLPQVKELGVIITGRLLTVTQLLTCTGATPSTTPGALPWTTVALETVTMRRNFHVSLVLLFFLTLNN